MATTAAEAVASGSVRDEVQETTNLVKHAVALSLAREIDLDRAVIVEDRRREYGERRFIVYASLQGRVHVIISSPPR